MATNEKASLPHIERTAAEPRDEGLHPVILADISQINSSIRLLRLAPVNKEPMKFQPGQWVDLHIPNLPSPGGFTITSIPSLASTYVELAIQRPPTPKVNIKTSPVTPAHWLWQPPSQILNTPLAIRVGGSFIWPPSDIPLSEIKRVVFIAGGVGINPLISMLSSIIEKREKDPTNKLGHNLVFLYAVRTSLDSAGRSEDILFLDRLRDIFSRLSGLLGEDGELKLFLTGEGGEKLVEGSEALTLLRRRIEGRDLEDALGGRGERDGTLVYVCGPPGMTDHFVELAGKAEGMNDRRVLSEKWW